MAYPLFLYILSSLQCKVVHYKEWNMVLFCDENIHDSAINFIFLQIFLWDRFLSGRWWQALPLACWPSTSWSFRRKPFTCSFFGRSFCRNICPWLVSYIMCFTDIVPYIMLLVFLKKLDLLFIMLASCKCGTFSAFISVSVV